MSTPTGRKTWFRLFIILSLGMSLLPALTAAFAQDPAQDPLFKRIYGCQAAGAIGDALGDKVEGDRYTDIQAKYGILDHFVEGVEKGKRKPNDYTPDEIKFDHVRAPGMTEDGYERHLLCADAIIRKGGRIDVNDLVATWKHDIDPNQYGYLLGWQDQFAYYSAWAGVTPKEIGEFASWPGMIGTTKMIMPVGMVNAGNPDQAGRDGLNIGHIKDTVGMKDNFALEVCPAAAAAAAEALKENATVDSVIAVALSYLSEAPKADCLEMLEAAKKAKNFDELPPIYDKKYADRGLRGSSADEIFAGALLAFYTAQGQPREAILNAIRLGRDTDCKAYIAGSLAGALKGIDALPPEWVKTVEDAVVVNPYTVSRRTSKEIALAIYRIVQANKSGATAPPPVGLDALIRLKAGKPEGELAPADYEKIVALDAGSRGVADLAPLEKLTRLEWLKLDNNQIVDLAPLKSLTKLVYLDLGHNCIVDISPLAELKNLRTLYLDFNQIEDVSALGGLTQLKALNLTENRIADIAPLAGLVNLGSLYLGDNRIRDVAPLAQMTSLFSLGLTHNRIKDAGPLQHLTKLIGLYLGDNRISDAGPLAGLTETLKYLTLNDNRFDDASSLASLRRLILLNLNGNTIGDAAPLAALDKLIYLDLGKTGIRDLAPVASMPKLRHLNIEGNSVGDLAPLKGLADLVYLRSNSNKIQTIDALGGLANLKFLYLEKNNIADFKPVASRYPSLEEKDFALK